MCCVCDTPTHAAHRTRGGGRPSRERTTPVLPPHEGQLAVCPRLRCPHTWGRGRGLRERAGARRRGRLALRPRVPLKSCPRCRVPGLWEATLEGLSCSPLFGNAAPARGRACCCRSGTPDSTLSGARRLQKPVAPGSFICCFLSSLTTTPHRFRKLLPSSPFRLGLPSQHLRCLTPQCARGTRCVVVS